MDGLYIHMRATVDRIDFFFGLFVELKAKDIILRDILVLELAVQVIEFYILYLAHTGSTRRTRRRDLGSVF